MIYNCCFYTEINNAIILIDSSKAPIVIKQRVRNIMPIGDCTDFDGLQIRRSHRDYTDFDGLYGYTMNRKC